MSVTEGGEESGDTLSMAEAMTTPREHVTTRLRRSRDTIALIDATVAKARQEFDDPDIDRQRVLELLLDHRLEDLKRDGGMQETRFSLFRGRPIQEGFVEVPFRWPVAYYEAFRRLGVEIDPW